MIDHPFNTPKHALDYLSNAGRICIRDAATQVITLGGGPRSSTSIRIEDSAINMLRNAGWNVIKPVNKPNRYAGMSGILGSYTSGYNMITGTVFGYATGRTIVDEAQVPAEPSIPPSVSAMSQPASLGAPNSYAPGFAYPQYSQHSDVPQPEPAMRIVKRRVFSDDPDAPQYPVSG